MARQPRAGLSGSAIGGGRAGARRSSRRARPSPIPVRRRPPALAPPLPARSPWPAALAPPSPHGGPSPSPRRCPQTENAAPEQCPSVPQSAHEPWAGSSEGWATREGLIRCLQEAAGDTAAASTPDTSYAVDKAYRALAHHGQSGAAEHHRKSTCLCSCARRWDLGLEALRLTCSSNTCRPAADVAGTKLAPQSRGEGWTGLILQQRPFLDLQWRGPAPAKRCVETRNRGRAARGGRERQTPESGADDAPRQSRAREGSELHARRHEYRSVTPREKRGRDSQHRAGVGGRKSWPRGAHGLPRSRAESPFTANTGVAVRRTAVRRLIRRRRSQARPIQLRSDPAFGARARARRFPALGRAKQPV